MKRAIFSVWIGLLVVCMVACAAHGKEGGNAPMKVDPAMDLKQTLDYFQTMVAGEKFPESTEAVYYAAYSLQALQG